VIEFTLLIQFYIITFLLLKCKYLYIITNIIVSDYVSSVEKCSLYDVQKIIQEWLRHAGDRINYLKKKKLHMFDYIMYNVHV